jgi:hypothetical protein
MLGLGHLNDRSGRKLVHGMHGVSCKDLVMVKHAPGRPSEFVYGRSIEQALAWDTNNSRRSRVSPAAGGKQHNPPTPGENQSDDRARRFTPLSLFTMPADALKVLSSSRM